MDNCKCTPVKSLAEQVIEYREFFSLVKKMREAQIEKDESDQGYRSIPHICILEKKDRLESEVDEYLKKMEEEK